MKAKLFAVCLATSLLASCGEEIVTGPVIVPESQVGNLRDVPKSTTTVENVYIKFQDKFEVKTAVALFEPKGIIAGERSPMIPLSKRQSDLNALGITTQIDLNGNNAVLQYNDDVIRFKVDDSTLFINNDATQLVDVPYYHNQTIYVPLIPILDALKIDYSLSGSDITIGGMYTDDSSSGERIEQRND